MKFTVDFLKKALIRALHTFAQTAAGMITVGAALSEVDWLRVLSVSAVAFIISFLKSFVVGIPESGIIEGTMTIDNSDADDPKVDFDFGPLEIDQMVEMKTVKMNIVKGAITDMEE